MSAAAGLSAPGLAAEAGPPGEREQDHACDEDTRDTHRVMTRRAGDVARDEAGQRARLRGHVENPDNYQQKADNCQDKSTNAPDGGVSASHG